MKREDIKIGKPYSVRRGDHFVKVVVNDIVTTAKANGTTSHTYILSAKEHNGRRVSFPYQGCSHIHPASRTTTDYLPPGAYGQPYQEKKKAADPFNGPEANAEHDKAINEQLNNGRAAATADTLGPPRSRIDSTLKNAVDNIGKRETIDPNSWGKYIHEAFRPKGVKRYTKLLSQATANFTHRLGILYRVLREAHSRDEAIDAITELIDVTNVIEDESTTEQPTFVLDSKMDDSFNDDPQYASSRAKRELKGVSQEQEDDAEE